MREVGVRFDFDSSPGSLWPYYIRDIPSLIQRAMCLVPWNDNNNNISSSDTIDVTNLNRQFLFRSKDVGQSKAVVAAKFINERCPWMNVEPYHGRIQDKDASFYRRFKVVISGLDNVEARR